MKPGSTIMMCRQNLKVAYGCLTRLVIRPCPSNLGQSKTPYNKNNYQRTVTANWYIEHCLLPLFAMLKDLRPKSQLCTYGSFTAPAHRAQATTDFIKSSGITRFWAFSIRGKSTEEKNIFCGHGGSFGSVGKNVCFHSREKMERVVWWLVFAYGQMCSEWRKVLWKTIIFKKWTTGLTEWPTYYIETLFSFLILFCQGNLSKCQWNVREFEKFNIVATLTFYHFKNATKI